MQLLTNHLSYLISKMWSLYTLSQSLTGIELFFNFILLVLTIVKGFDKGCGYSLYYTIIMIRGVATEKFSGGHLKIGGAQRGYFRNFGRFYGFFIAISEIIGGARAPPAPPVTTPLEVAIIFSAHPVI